jgi:adenine-specific DNA-methyltransferase
VTGKPCKVPEDGWRFVEETMLQKIKDGYVVFRADHKKPPIYKSFIYLADLSKADLDDDTNEGQREVLGSVFIATHSHLTMC